MVAIVIGTALASDGQGGEGGASIQRRATLNGRTHELDQNRDELLGGKVEGTVVEHLGGVREQILRVVHLLFAPFADVLEHGLDAALGLQRMLRPAHDGVDGAHNRPDHLRLEQTRLLRLDQHVEEVHGAYAGRAEQCLVRDELERHVGQVLHVGAQHRYVVLDERLEKVEYCCYCLFILVDKIKRMKCQ